MMSHKNFAIIAREAKQSISTLKDTMDCLVAGAPLRKRFAFVAGNDGFYSPPDGRHRQ
jgi:hypothetical protein